MMHQELIGNIPDRNEIIYHVPASVLQEIVDTAHDIANTEVPYGDDHILMARLCIDKMENKAQEIDFIIRTFLSGPYTTEEQGEQHASTYSG